MALAAAVAMICRPAAVPEAPKSKMLGNPTAPMRLELYGDFTCPHCKHLHEDNSAADHARLRHPQQGLPGVPRLHADRPRPRAFAATLPPTRRPRRASDKYQAAADALFKTQASWAMTGQIWPNISSAFTPEEQKKIQALVKDPTDRHRSAERCRRGQYGPGPADAHNGRDLQGQEAALERMGQLSAFQELRGSLLAGK